MHKTILTPYGFVYTPEALGEQEVTSLANSWLVEFVNMQDAWWIEENGKNRPLVTGLGGFYGLLSNLDAQEVLTNEDYAGPGGWNGKNRLNS